MGLLPRRKKAGAFPKQVLHIGREFPSREEIVRFMRDEGLPAGTLETLYTADGEVRCVIFRTASGYVSYCFERLAVFDEEAYRHSAAPGVWQPFPAPYAVPVYTSLRDLKRELVRAPEYLTYFGNGDNG